MTFRSRRRPCSSPVLLPGETGEFDAGGELRFVVSCSHRIVAYARRAPVALALTEGLALSAHHERVPSGRDQIVALTYDLVILVAVIAENFLGELAHVTGDRELAELHVAAHFLDRRLGMKSAAVVFGVRRHHRRPEPPVDIGELLSRALLMLQAIVRPRNRD